MRLTFFLFAFLAHQLFVCVEIGIAADAPPTTRKGPPSTKVAIAQPGTPAPAPVEESDAVKITKARESLKSAQRGIEKLQQRLDDPNGDYQMAEAEFEGLNQKLMEAKTKAAALRKEGKTADAEAADKIVKTITGDWELAKQHFDIAIRQRKATIQAIEGLKERKAADQKVLDRLEGKAKPEKNPPSGDKKDPPATTSNPTPTNTTPTPSPTKVPATPVSRNKPETPTAGKSTTESEPPASPAPTVPALPGMPTAIRPVEVKPVVAVDASAPDEHDPLVQLTKSRLESYRIALTEAESRVRLAEERVRTMERTIQSAENFLKLERESIEVQRKSIARWNAALTATPPPDEERQHELTDKIAMSEQRLTESQERAKRIASRIGTLQENLAELKAELGIAENQAKEAGEKVSATEAELASLLSPTSPRNIFRWMVAKAPRILLVLVGMILLHLTVRQFSRHIVRFITRNSQRGSPEDRENRASTLVGVFRYAAGVVVLLGGGVMLLDEIGLPIVPLMGGAAVVGLAVAFGAQNLIRDYFTGFMMLMEDQYSVNDVVKIGAISGLVEAITLRMTVLRDLEGIRHFIPHGTITHVSNLTHGWSRAMFDIPVAYKENVDRVIEILIHLGREIRQDACLGKHILEDPEMLGVDALADSGVVIKFLLKTRPLQQWPIKREMLRRIKNRFDELGIEIPFPHRRVYHQFLDSPAASGIHPATFERTISAA